MTDAELAELVRFVRLHGSARKLLAEHQDDGSGRCAVCSTGGGTGRVSHPCTIRRGAEKADDPLA